ncbi:efflux RND transporter permease subunit [Nannocystis radixulma]|uniref:Efflux RND transporter permease subunit n=1 Tax=Nannocystis radixulma TaxID=2995305 RepID=A0ABT5BD15_9BACT|nr:efflux RND transporter permease subunit [Nannocystis radixulma]MDC0671613.1 efflux RND transporter permease subunit [Nannocystis radixulma]
MSGEPRPRGMVAGAVGRPVTTTMVLVALVVFGLVALTRLPLALLPDLSYPSVTVRTEMPDAAPQEVEELLTRPVEELVSAVPGVVQVESVSREGTSEVVLDFGWGTDMDRGLDDVREKLDRVVLPTGVQRPVVLRYDPAQEPILRLALVSHESMRPAELWELADRRVKRAIEKIPGVAAVQIHGGDKEEIRVELDPQRLTAMRVTADEVAQAIRRDNVNRPGGALSEQKSRYLLRTVHEARTPAELEEVVVRSQNGAELRLRDVADIARVPVEREELALVGGREAVELAVYREGDANTVAVSRAVQTSLPELRLGTGQKVVVLSDQAAFIESAIAEVQENTLLGGALAVLVLLFFLRDLRATLVIAAAIPISLLVTFVPLQLLGVSLNLMSLGGLALGVGMLVDNSIVVLESIARVREREPHARAASTAIRGATEVAASVIASTLTTVAVFLPMAFVEGVAGRLIRDLAYTVSLSIVSSMFVSLTLVPVLQSLGGPGDAAEREPPPPRSLLVWLLAPFALLFRGLRLATWAIGHVLRVIIAPATAAYAAVERAYPPLLKAALRWRFTVVALAVVLCVTAVQQLQGLGSTLLPEIQQGEFFVQISLPQGSSLERSADLARRVAAAVERDPAVAQVFARVGSMTAGDSATGTVAGTHLAQVNVRLHPGLPAPEEAALEESLMLAMAGAAADPEATLRLGRPALFSFDAPIEVRIFSEEPERAIAHARALLPDLRAIEGLADVAPDDLAGRPEVRVDFDRERLSRLNLGVDAAALAVQRAVQGEIATKMHAADRQLDVRVQLPQVDRTRAADVGKIAVAVIGDVPVTVAAVADLVEATGPAEIRHLDGRRGLRIRARLTGEDLGTVAARVEDVLAAHDPGDGRVQAELGGQAESLGGSMKSMMFAALIAVFLIYVVMASSFESLHHPLLIMGTVPLAVVGVAWACVLTGTPISAMVGMGAIILGGIVVNNAIVLVNTVNYRRGQGMDTGPALIEAGRLRLRPIVMTTATTVLGLLPMAAGVGDGAALRQPLAVTVIGGLTAATLLTLVVIPCLYSLLPGKRQDAWADMAGED